MTNYHLKPPDALHPVSRNEAKEKRRKVLEAVRQRRKIIYQRYRQKMQVQGESQHLA